MRRGRLLNLAAVGRAAGFLLVAALIVAAIVQVARQKPQLPASPLVASTSADSLKQELARCQRLAASAISDGACEAAWAENRRRFFTYRQPAQTGPAPAQSPTTSKSDR
jgi:conjugative transfer region protein TrbK